jgi:hypothetical protein
LVGQNVLAHLILGHGHFQLQQSTLTRFAFKTWHRSSQSASRHQVGPPLLTTCLPSDDRFQMNGNTVTDQILGRLERVDLRNVWISEAANFTPWLARPENMAVLAETLAIDLELEAQEKAVGPFRADLLCKDMGTDRWVLIRPKKQIRSELYIAGDQAKAFFGLLKNQKEAIEQELGYPLEWEELPARRDCRVSAYLNDIDPEDESTWPAQHVWLAKRLNDMHRVFVQRVGAMDISAVPPD